MHFNIIDMDTQLWFQLSLKICNVTEKFVFILRIWLDIPGDVIIGDTYRMN
jgi:hypothetical protein